MSEAKINLIVLYTAERVQLREELTAFRLLFEEHQHGNGPIHDV